MRFLTSRDNDGKYLVVSIDISEERYLHSDGMTYSLGELIAETKRSRIQGVSPDGELTYFSLFKLAQYTVGKLKLSGKAVGYVNIVGDVNSDFAAFIIKDGADDSSFKTSILYGCKELPNTALRYSGVGDLILPDSVKVLHRLSLGASSWNFINLEDYNGTIEPMAFCDANFTALKLPRFMSELPRGLFARSNFKRIFPTVSLRKLGQYAFYKSKGFSSFHIPYGVQIIEKYCFFGSSIESVAIPENCKRIEECAFAECSSLSYVEFKGTDIEISDTAFLNCNKIRTISGTLPILKKMKFGCYKDGDRWRRVPSGGIRLSSSGQFIREVGIASNALDVIIPLDNVSLIKENGEVSLISLEEYYKLIGVFD